MSNIDARGLSCPQPVLLAKKAVDLKPETVTIMVDNETAKGNVLRFLKNAGYTVEVEMSGETIQLQAKRA